MPTLTTAPRLSAREAYLLRQLTSPRTNMEGINDAEFWLFFDEICETLCISEGLINEVILRRLPRKPASYRYGFSLQAMVAARCGRLSTPTLLLGDMRGLALDILSSRRTS